MACFHSPTYVYVAVYKVKKSKTQLVGYITRGDTKGGHQKFGASTSFLPAVIKHGEAKVDANDGGSFTAILGAAKVDASVCQSATTPAIAGTRPAIAEEDDESCRRRGQGERGGERESKGAGVQYRGGRYAP